MTHNNLILWEDILIKLGIGIIVVFVTLVILVLLFKGFSKLISYQQKLRLQKKDVKVKSVNDDSSGIPTAVLTAIGLGISMYFSDVHDDESNIITIKRTEQHYSPWKFNK